LGLRLAPPPVAHIPERSTWFVPVDFELAVCAP
jgi:hypothetical protein